MKMYSSRLIASGLMGMAYSCGLAFAQVEPAPSEHPAPTLERICTETQALYESVRPGLVRVTLPVPSWMTQLGGQENPLNKWALPQQVKDTLGDASNVNTMITPTTQATTQ